ncbi:PAS and ANTAR domain-containing protein [soil metagenome]
MTGSEPAGEFPSARVGSFTMDFATQRFNWSAEVAAIHGYAAKAVDVTAEFVLAHKHPEDRAHIRAQFKELVQTKTASSSRHRIVDTVGDVHDVVVVSKTMLGADGDIIGVQGFFIDISAVFENQVDDAVDLAVAEFAVHRAVVEQAKGMVMMAYSITADRAFDVLTWRSQQTDTKIGVLCELIVKRALDEITVSNGTRVTFDDILLNCDHHGSTEQPSV